LTVGFIMGAHLEGVLLAKNDITFRDRALMWFIALSSLGAGVAFALVRERYLVAGASSGSSLSFQGHTISLPEIGTTLTLGPVLGPLVFVAANAVIFLATTALSYLHHDPLDVLLRKLEHQRRKVVAQRRRARRRYEEIVQCATAVLTQLEALEALHKSLFRAYGRQIDRQRQRYEMLWKLFASANVRVRRVAVRITALNAHITLEVREPFSTGAVPQFECETVMHQIERLLRTRSSRDSGWQGEAEQPLTTGEA
jgi:hypothetical protein